jgi:hypothetical protein
MELSPLKFSTGSNLNFFIYACRFKNNPYFFQPQSVIPEYTCTPTCFAFKMKINNHMTTIQHHSNRVHFLVWISKFGSLYSIAFLIMNLIVIGILTVIKGLIKVSKKPILEKYILLAPEDPLKPSILHRFQNFEFFRDSKSQRGTICGLCLTILYPILLFGVLLGILIYNYQGRVLNNWTPRYDKNLKFVSTQSEKISFTKYFDCIHLFGCYYVKVSRGDYLNAPVVKPQSQFIDVGKRIEMKLDWDHYHLLFIENRFISPEYPLYTTFGNLVNSKEISAGNSPTPPPPPPPPPPPDPSTSPPPFPIHNPPQISKKNLNFTKETRNVNAVDDVILNVEGYNRILPTGMGFGVFI